MSANKILVTAPVVLSAAIWRKDSPNADTLFALLCAITPTTTGDGWIILRILKTLKFIPEIFAIMTQSGMR